MGMGFALMDAGEIPCRISVGCPLNPSEDPQRVLRALSNVFPAISFEQRDFGIRGSAASLQCMDRLREEIRNRQYQKSLGRQIRLNAQGGSFWFYLNKQAAFAGVAVPCERDDESPLGPIRVSVESARIDEAAHWILGSA